MKVAVEEIVPRLPRGGCRLLLVGAAGNGKSYLAARLAGILAGRGHPVHCVGADPGTPAFGLPGTVGLAQWYEGEWRAGALRPLCSLDAARFRLPLIEAVRRLMPDGTDGYTLVDTPGVVRGAAGAELLDAFIKVARPHRVLVLVRNSGEPPLARELAALSTEPWVVEAAPAARRPGPAARRRYRTALWDAYLGQSEVGAVDLSTVAALGTPPPLDVPGAWTGRQVALMNGARLLAMGEVESMAGTVLRVKAPPFRGTVCQLLVRDARRGTDRLLGTASRFGSEVVRWAPPSDTAPNTEARALRPVVRAGSVVATLVNGVFGDPLLHLRLCHRRRSLLFDLGDSARLPARLVHQVTDVFISHAHADHIGGFIWFLRSRMGDFPACRFYGPPGLAGNIEGFLRGIHWDRIGDRGPRFEVAEVHGGWLHRYRLQAGYLDAVYQGREAVEEGVLLDEAEFRVRAETLDHGGTPVLAFAFEPAMQANVRKERLASSGLPSGSWLTALTSHAAAGQTDVLLTLPDGSRAPVHQLAEILLLTEPGRKITYATDLGDTPDNRARLASLALGAHVLFCEATFLPRHAEQAARTGHLTTAACAEIAAAAGAAHLVPFHFSARYEHEPRRVYEDMVGRYSRTVVPDLLGGDGGVRGSA